MPKVYEEIAQDLRQQIRSGGLQPGDRLPSQVELTRIYGRGVPTVRAALHLLETEGLIDREHGRGVFVRAPRRTVRRTNERHQWEKNRARETFGVRSRTGATEHDTGLDIGDLVFSAKYRQVAAREELAGLFGVDAGTPLVERTYKTRYARESAPFDVSRSYLVRDHVAGNPALLDDANEPWPGGTPHQLHTVGIEIDTITETVRGARVPTQEEARALGMSPGMAVIDLRKMCTDVDGRVVEVAYVLLPGDRTHLTFVTPLERW